VPELSELPLIKGNVKFSALFYNARGVAPSRAQEQWYEVGSA